MAIKRKYHLSIFLVILALFIGIGIAIFFFVVTELPKTTYDGIQLPKPPPRKRVKTDQELARLNAF